MRSAHAICRSAQVASRRSLFQAPVYSALGGSSAVRTATGSTRGIQTSKADPLSKQYKYWNREESKHGEYAYLLDMSPWSVKREARIVSLSDPNDSANDALHKGKMPYSSQLLGVGETLDDVKHLADEKPNVIFASPSCPRACLVLPQVLEAFPTIEWVHVRSAGLDFLSPEELQTNPSILFTNAKGQFSSSLAEYIMMACSYFAKDLPLLMRQKQAQHWEKYDVEELRGKTMGVVGYGDIGRATAKLANAYGMRVVALRRHPEISVNDPLCDKVMGTGKAALNELMAESDYVVCSAPSTISTRGMINEDAFAAAKEGMVFINLGRGPVVDEKAMVNALKSGQLKGAALDVFAEEPLPKGHDLWGLDNVLISPHNMDQVRVCGLVALAAMCYYWNMMCITRSLNYLLACSFHFTHDSLNRFPRVAHRPKHSCTKQRHSFCWRTCLVLFVEKTCSISSTAKQVISRSRDP